MTGPQIPTQPSRAERIGRLVAAATRKNELFEGRAGKLLIRLGASPQERCGIWSRSEATSASLDRMEGRDGPIRVLIADDEEDKRVLLQAVIEAEEGMTVVAAAEDADGAVRMSQALGPDVAVLDWMMPGGGGSAAKRITDSCDDVRIIAFTAGDPIQASYDMLGSGAIGMLPKSSSNDEIIAGIRSVLRH